MSEKNDNDLQKALGLAVALGALAVGVAATVMNNERTRQLREEMKVRIDDLGRQVDALSSQAQSRVSDLSSHAQRTIEERRPDIEQTIQKSREAVLGGLDKARSVVEQGADKAQEYVQRASLHGSDNGSGDSTAEQSVVDSDGAGEVQYTSDAADATPEASMEMSHASGGKTAQDDESLSGWTGNAGEPSDSGSSSYDQSDEGADPATSYLRDVVSQDAEPGGDSGFSVYGTAGASDAEANTGDVAVNTGMSEQDSVADVGGTGEASDSFGYVEQAQFPIFDQWDHPSANTESADNIGNLGDSSLDALRDDDLSSSSRDGAVGAEDMSGAGDHIEQAAEHSGFQLEGSMHSHAEDEASTSSPTPRSKVTRQLYDSIESAEASTDGDIGEAGEAGAPEFGGGEGSASSFGTGGVDLTMGEPTIPFRGDTLTNSDVDNESPRPGEDRTV